MATTREITGELRRRRALTGEPLDPGMAESIVRAGLRDESDRAIRSRGVALQERAFEQGVKERRDERRTQNLAGTIGAGVKVGGIFAENKLQNRALDIAEAKGERETALLSQLFGSGGEAGTEAFAGGLEESIMETAGTEATGVSTLVAGAGSLAAGKAAEALGANKQFAGIAEAGTALLLGAPLLAGVSAVNTLIGGEDKVICAELNRQGYLSDDILALDCLYSVMWVDTPTHVGYRIFADKLARVLRSNRLIRAIIAPFAIAWAHAMAEKVDRSITISYWHRYLGNFLMKTISPICRVVGRRLLNG